MVRAWIAALVAVIHIPAAAADEMSARGPHWGLGGGGYLAITGDESRRVGSALSAELLPGGGFGRLGIRVEAFGLGQALPDAFLAGVIFEAAAARPKLQLSLVATAGATSAGEPVARLAVQTQLWIVGPIAVAADGGALLRIDGSDTELFLESGLLFRLAR